MKHYIDIYAILKVTLTILVAFICIYLIYIKTGIGFEDGYLPITGIPIPIASVITCFIFPAAFFAEFDNFIENRR